MRKHYFLVGLLMLIFLTSFGQETYITRQLSDMVGQLEWNRTTQKGADQIDGSPYLQEDFKPGEVYYDGKYKVENILLRLNLYNDEFEYKDKSVVMAFSNPGRIDKIVIDNELFYYVKETESHKLSGFVKASHEEFPAVLTKMKIDFLEKEEAKPYVDPKPDRFERTHDKYYIMKSDSEVAKISSVKKLIKYLGDHGTELTKFAKEEKISASDVAELSKLMEYYHSL